MTGLAIGIGIGLTWGVGGGSTEAPEIATGQPIGLLLALTYTVT